MTGDLRAVGVVEGMHRFEYHPDANGNRRKSYARVLYFGIEGDQEFTRDYGEFELSADRTTFDVPRPSLELSGRPIPYALFALVADQWLPYTYPFEDMVTTAVSAGASMVWSTEDIAGQFPVVDGIVEQFYSDPSRKRGSPQNDAADLNRLLKARVSPYFMNEDQLALIIENVQALHDGQIRTKRDIEERTGCFACMLSFYIALALASFLPPLISAFRRVRVENLQAGEQAPRYLQIWLDNIALEIHRFFAGRALNDIRADLQNIISGLGTTITGIGTLTAVVAGTTCKNAFGFTDCHSGF